VVYGILSAPLVLPVALVTNAVDVTCSFFKNCALSFWNNLRCSFNLMGEYGVMGPRLPYQDNRGTAAKSFYGVITAPFVAVAAVVTNTINLVGAYFKNWEDTIKKPAMLISGLVVGLGLALPMFALRKTFKGLYNCTLRPIVDCINGKEFNGLRLLKGVANLVTLGGFSIVKKVFKLCTGYRDRFGFSHQAVPADGNREGLVPNYFNNVQALFRRAIHLATTGSFPGVDDGQGIFRPFMRVFYGMRHKVEEIVKAFHDAYVQYAASLGAQEKTNVAYSMHTFFGSGQFNAAKAAIQANLRDGEDRILASVEQHLRPVAPGGM
jgi:hypothetical protein